jgi:hypothetical protein
MSVRLRAVAIAAVTALLLLAGEDRPQQHAATFHAASGTSAPSATAAVWTMPAVLAPSAGISVPAAAAAHPATRNAAAPSVHGLLASASGRHVPHLHGPLHLHDFPLLI